MQETLGVTGDWGGPAGPRMREFRYIGCLVVVVSDARWRNSQPNNEKLAELNCHLAVKNLAAQPGCEPKNLAEKTKIWRN